MGVNLPAPQYVAAVWEPVSRWYNTGVVKTRFLKNFLALLILPLLFFVWLPGPASAQEPDGQAAAIDWRELPTDRFLIVYAEGVQSAAPGEEAVEIECDCGIEQAEHYAAFIDDIYADLATVFEVELQTPINLRLFPTEESYYEVNPLAEALTGVVAHALNSREEIAIALPRTRPLTEEELVNNIRHELTHLFASYLSDGKLTAGFQEGIAQYLEKPVGRSAPEPALLQQAFDQGRLLTWAELDEARQVYRDPQVAYPQTLSIVTFLVDRYGLPTFIEFLRVSAQEPGYRSALEAAYGKPADELEAEWLAYLPEYFEGRWQINAIYAYDLSRVTTLVEQGAYSSAETELTEIISLLESTDQTDTLATAEALLARARQGQAAAALADEARQALQTSDYALAVTKGNQAIAAYEALGYRDRIPEIQLYIHRAEIGREALGQLSRGEQLLDSLRFIEAEEEIYEATILLQSLNNQAASQRGQELLAESAQRQSLLAYAILGIGLALLVMNGLRRMVNYFTANPLEVEFS